MRTAHARSAFTSLLVTHRALTPLCLCVQIQSNLYTKPAGEARVRLSSLECCELMPQRGSKEDQQFRDIWSLEGISCPSFRTQSGGTSVGPNRCDLTAGPWHLRSVPLEKKHRYPAYFTAPRPVHKLVQQAIRHSNRYYVDLTRTRINAPKSRFVADLAALRR